jgi:hypothetical protein
MFFWFFEPFFACWASKFSKSANMTKRNFFVRKNKKNIYVNTEFHDDFKSVENFLKNAPKKVISKISLTNMSKGENISYFRHFFRCIFKTFSTESKSV